MDVLQSPDLLNALVAVALARPNPAHVVDAAVLLADHLVLAASQEVRPPRGAPDSPLGALTAAIALSEAAHLSDEDDVHWASLTHPGGVVWPVVLGMGDGQPDRRAAAAFSGYELLARLSHLHGSGQREYWQPTATCGSAAVALTACVLLQRSELTAVAACAHALSAGGGLMSAVRSGSGSRLVNRTAAIATGLVAADAAMRGLEGTTQLLERADGLLAARGCEPSDSPITPEPAISSTSVRLYPGVGFLLPILTAVAALGSRATKDAPLLLTLSGACRGLGPLRPAVLAASLVSSSTLGQARQALRSEDSSRDVAGIEVRYDADLLPHQATATAGGTTAQAWWPRPSEVPVIELAAKWSDLMRRVVDPNVVIDAAAAYLSGEGGNAELTEALR